MDSDLAHTPVRKQQSRLYGIDGARSMWEVREILTGEEQKRNHVSN